MKKLAIVANCEKPRAVEVLRRIGEKAGLLGMELYADPSTARLVDRCVILSTEELFDRVDAVMALGGDGTMLRVARMLDGRDRPVIGLNIGGLGFLTSVAEGELDRALESLAEDRYQMSVRSIAECTVTPRTGSSMLYRALNDVVVNNGQSSRVMTLDVRVDGDYVTSYVCDGLVVSTPTGSTGHSLSAGGPILHPGTPAFVLSLICPHTLSSRPLVLPDDRVVGVTVSKCAGSAWVSADGQVGQALNQGDSLEVRKSDRSIRFIHLPGTSYFAVLRQKLHWRGSSV